MNKVVCLIGNPNSGKTTLFNTLTGGYQKVGNWTGVTTEKTEGLYKKNKNVKVIDLPGLYSFNAKAKDEKVVIDYLKKTPPQVIISVVDGTNLERNLFLTLKLLELNIPTIVAVNMCDALEKQGVTLDQEKLSRKLGVPILKISALKNINLDLLMEKAINLTDTPKNVIKDNIKSDRPEDVYAYIERLINQVVKTTKRIERTDKIDNFITGRFTGIIIFFLIITAVYFFSVKGGGLLGGFIAEYFEKSSNNISAYLTEKNFGGVFVGLFSDGVVKGLGTVFSFLPQILILFFFLSIIEESGYASRIALIFDRFFSSFGLSGKSLLPLIVSSGCTVTGLMSTRTIESTSERRMTVFISPFIPCGAKTALFGWFSSVIFNGNALVASSMYFIGATVSALSGKFLSKFKAFKEENNGFLLEIPPYRFPSFKNVFSALLEKTKDFTVKAGTVILGVSVLLWLLTNFGFSGYTDGNVNESFVYSIGNAVKYVFYPLGFGSAQASVAILSGLVAKEAIIESLAIFSESGQIFANGVSAYSFMTFVLLSPPCTASLITAKRELGNTKWFILMLVFQTTTAYVVALMVNLTGIILSVRLRLILSAIFVIIILTIAFISLKCAFKSGCNFCNKCGEKKCPKNTKRNTTL